MFAWWWRDAGTLAKRQRERPLPEQRGRRRDDTAAGAGVVSSPEVTEREGETAAARVLAWSFRWGGSGGGEKWRRSSAWWPELQREMKERNGGAARARKKGAAVLSPN
ncbi:hypothetical protein DEO72_LG11g2254 [Vigna unguiculata]|uniref:Uncharacterized protein n=1 Tax=Vigna unguiculata TaxID=3917 RepID=A0A4D6NSL2_VIGUN|nr:hypothetical protein DEO72_LG11g2254 [Vigna unguiculata]